MKIRRMLVTGAGGMVGSYLPEVFSDMELTLTDIVGGFTPLDLRDPRAVMEIIRSVDPEAVLHLGAATDVDRCQQEPEWAYQTNAVGTQNVALACLAQGAALVYVSTAAVFPGDKPEPYIEFDDPRPANLYGRSKWIGEQIVTSLLPRSYIVRAGWMIGGGSKDKKFVGKITRLILDGKNPIQAVNDKWGSPTYAKDLLKGIRALLGTGYYGLYHMANQGSCTRYDIACAIREILGRKEISVAPVSSDCFPLPAPRGRSEAIRNLKAELLGLEPMRPWREALREYVQAELVPILAGR
ncbi:MAG: dTDP-4-dehydrorhamnose reductase [Candidatus Omnitrophica bacterium]|nr:dTDP-4-dehydrorhamnose reductase [Candidatus Omnitrophota bacterium]